MAEFSVHLGGGLYLDSDGVLTHGPEPGKPVYPTPGGGLPIKPETVEKAFAGVKKALPDPKDPKSREKFDKILDGIGMLAEDKENLIGLLQTVGLIAGTIASVVPYVGAALAILSLFGFFKEGPSALELLVTRRFDELDRRVKSLEIQIEQRDLRDQRSLISAALAALSNYVTELKNTPPNATVLALRQQDLRSIRFQTGVAVRRLLDSSTYLASFDRDEHKWVWPWIQNPLYTYPKGSPPQRALMPPQGANVFDHRLMVPLAAFAVESFLTILRAVAPEFRSTRDAREDLWDYADLLEKLAENMRSQGLARTAYTASDFDIPWGLAPDEVIEMPFGLPARLSPNCTRFTVGALDLRNHNDAYFTPGFAAGSIQHPGAQYARQGLLNVRWIPPAVLERYEEPILALGPEMPNQPPRTRTLYRIVNREECAAAANAQAEMDYTNLLYSTGYLNLLHLVATLRNEATDPDRSQTVRSKTLKYRKAGTSVPVKVESGPILMTGMIEASAERQPQRYEATTWFTTQPLGRERPLHYRVYLRTLNASFRSPAYWHEQAYDTYHQVGYTNDPAHPGCQKLFTSTGQAMDELLIAEGVSIPDIREKKNVTAALEAMTFDWWIPVSPPFHHRFDAEAGIRLATLRAAGWSEELDQNAPPTSAENPPTSGGGSPAGGPSPVWHADSGLVGDRLREAIGVNLADSIGWEEAVEPAKGQHRMGTRATVELQVSLHWQGDRLTVSLKNRPSDRNYVVYVVVEETLGSGEVLHTVERIPVIGQMTFVPQAFFDAEAEAIALLNRTLREFARKYAISVSPIPAHGGVGDPHVGLDDVRPAVTMSDLEPGMVAADPVLRHLHLGTFGNLEGMTQLIAHAAQHPPAAALLRQTLTEHGVHGAALRSVFHQPAHSDADASIRSEGARHASE